MADGRLTEGISGIAKHLNQLSTKSAFRSVLPQTLAAQQQGKPRLSGAIAWRRTADPALAEHLAAWPDPLLRLHGQGRLPLDLATARRWVQLSASLGQC